MQHLDEGQLVEYLDESERVAEDGHRRAVRAHLAACGECSGRLDALARERHRAAEILRGSGPVDLVAPPFDQVVARSRGTTPRGTAPPWRWLAVAATTVMAVGVGWVARDLVVRDRGRAAVTTPALTAAQPPPSTSPSEEADARPVPSRDAPTALADRVDAGVPAPGGAPGGERAADRTGGGGVASGAALPRASVAAEDELVESVNARRAAEPRFRQAAPAGPPPAPAPARPALAPGATRESATGRPWRSVDRAEAEQLLGGAVARVSGLTMLGYAVRPADGGGFEVRTNQQLGGQTLELVQRRLAAGDELEPSAPAVDSAVRRDLSPRGGVAAEAGPEGRPARGTDTVQARIVRNGFAITGRAAIPLDSLVALLRRLRT